MITYKKYYAANEIDKFVNEKYFNDKKDGYFVDIGAFDGVSINNTFYFELLGWDGICFEPIPRFFDQLKSIRGCKCVNKALSSDKTPKKFLDIDGYSSALSGIIDNYDPKHINRINQEMSEYFQTSKEIVVDCGLFNEEIDRSNIDLLSIDTEGSELNIIKTIDFNKYKINVMIVEFNYENKELMDLLISHNLNPIQRIGCDIIFKNVNYDN